MFIIEINVSVFTELLIFAVQFGLSLGRSSPALAMAPTQSPPLPSYFPSRISITASRPSLGPTHPHIQRVLGTLSSGVKRPGREADQSPRFSAEVKNGGAIPPLPHMSSWRDA
jgi:hypothetical protein